MEGEGDWGYSRDLRSRRYVKEITNGRREKSKGSCTKTVGKLFLSLSGRMIPVLCCFSALPTRLSSVKNQGVFQNLPCEVWTFVLYLLLGFILFSTHPLQFGSIKMPCCSHTHRGVPNTHTIQRYLTPQQYIEMFQNTTDGQKAQYWREIFLSNNTEKYIDCKGQLVLTSM